MIFSGGGEGGLRYVTPDMIYDWEREREEIRAKSMNGKKQNRTKQKQKRHPENVC